MRPLSTIELLWHSVPLAILIDPCLSATLLSAFNTGSSSGVSHLIWMSLLGSFELLWRSVPLAIGSDPCLSTTLPVALKADSSSGVPSDCLTWVRPLSSIGPHWRSVPLAVLIDPRISTTLPLAFETDFTSNIRLGRGIQPFFTTLSSILCHLSWRTSRCQVMGGLR